MDEHERLIRDQEISEYGTWALGVVARALGINPEDMGDDELESRISRAIYKNTACGAWFSIDDDRFMVGTIVEGSDAEFCTDLKILKFIDMDEEKGANQIVLWLWSSLEECDEFADEVWALKESSHGE